MCMNVSQKTAGMFENNETQDTDDGQEFFPSA